MNIGHLAMNKSHLGRKNIYKLYKDGIIFTLMPFKMKNQLEVFKVEVGYLFL